MPPLSPSFARLWLGDTLSAVGSQVTLVALPLLAVLMLEASVSEMGVMRASFSIGGVATALFAGVLADRVPRRPLRLASDLAFALAIGVIPPLALAGWLRMEHLYAIGVLNGALTALSVVASQSFLPAIVPPQELGRANAQLQTSVSLAAVAGPALGGALVELLGPPQAIWLDALSFLLSAACIASIRASEPGRAVVDHRPIGVEIRAGLAAVYRHPRLRPLAIGIAVHFMCAGLVWSVLILFASRELGIRPFGIGAISAAAGAGLALGALLAPRAAARLGTAPPLVLGAIVAALGVLAFPLAAGPAALALLALGNLVFGVGIQVHGINLVSLRQRIVPSELLGRVNATFRFANFVAAGLGALVASALGASGLGSRGILVVGAAAFWLPPLILARAYPALRDPV